jgi:hypothetical protein
MYYMYMYMYYIFWYAHLKGVHSSPVPITGPEERTFMLTETSKCIGRNNISSYLVKYPNYITPAGTVLLKKWAAKKSLDFAPTSRFFIAFSNRPPLKPIVK